MGKITLVVGGARSGKSGIAEKIAESYANEKIYIATCPHLKEDAEMTERIAKHIQRRQGKGWKTIEEQVNIAEKITLSAEADVILIDCLTLWINNLLYASNNRITEQEIIEKCEEIQVACKKITGETILVSGEVGCGIIPEDKVTRLYRDLIGRCNQCMGEVANKVILVSCGIAHTIKSTP